MVLHKHNFIKLNNKLTTFSLIIIIYTHILIYSSIYFLVPIPL